MFISMELPSHSTILAESPHYALFHEAEYGYLFDKQNNYRIYLGDSYGDPDLGLIDKNEQWALLLGNSSYLWIPGNVFNLSDATRANGAFFAWPYAVRQVGDFEVEVLDDPWADDPAIYSFDIQTKVIKRVRDFQQLEGPYDEQLEIDW